MPSVTPSIELDLGNPIQACDGSALLDPNGEQILSCLGWIDIISDIRVTNPIIAKQGITGAGPTDLVGSPGSLSLLLDNSEGNSAATLGYYSPDKTGARVGFGTGTRIRLKLVSGATTLYAWLGRIKRIKPLAGKYSQRYVEVNAGDFMEQASHHKTQLIPVQVGQRNDQLLTTILANMPIQPLNTSFDVGPESFTTALNSEDDGKTFALTLFQKCIQSGMDYLYIRGNATDGETLVYQNRNTRVTNITSKATLNETMHALDVSQDADVIWNIVSVVTYPDKYDASAVVLFSYATEISLNPLASFTFTAKFVDPAGLSQRTSVYPGSEVTPVADTDYRMSSVANSGGNELNANLSVSVVWGGNSAEVTLTNTHASSVGYVNIFHLRGKGIYHYESVPIKNEDLSSQHLFGLREGTYNTPYQGNQNVALSFGTYLLNRWGRPMTVVNTVKFIANRSDALMTAALTCLIGDRITIVESVTGISKDFFINAATYTLKAGNILEVEWILDPARSLNIWILDDPVLSLLGTSTYLAL